MRTIFFTPFRLAIGWGISPRVLNLLGITMLVLLRLSVGWHFHSEGSEKYRQGDWDAAPFFANAKGPFADEFRSIVWDYNGEFRRNPESTKWWFEEYRSGAAAYYQFSQDDIKASENQLKKAVADLGVILEDNSVELMEYDLGVKRIAKMEEEQYRTGVESLAGQLETVRKENNGKLKPVLVEIDELWDGFEDSVNSLAADNQRRESPPYSLQKPRTGRIDTSVLNRIIPYFDLAIGWCLLLGLFTPVASLAAAGFLGSVFLSQYPPGTGPTSSNYQLIECMACLVLASTGAGRFAGLDYFLHLFVRRSEARRAGES